MQRISSTCLAKTPDMKSAGTYCSVWVPLVFLTGIWTAIIFIVNPVGEFMVNDDWAFVRCLESLMREGRLETTGHGPSNAPGGPALITHLLWGLAFVKTAGFSLTVLRVSVLTLGVPCIICRISPASPMRRVGPVEHGRDLIRRVQSFVPVSMLFVHDRHYLHKLRARLDLVPSHRR